MAQKSSRTYAGIPEEYASLESAKIVIVPVPYDGTSTWGKGSDKGPEAFLAASENMELFDIETESEPYKVGIYLAEPLKLGASSARMVSKVQKEVLGYLEQNKFVTVIGGEHSISIGTIRAFASQFEDLTVVQLDAHTDLRPEFHGDKYNHACAVYEASQTLNLIQVGIRSMDESEMQYMNRNQTYFAHEVAKNDKWMDKAVKQMGTNVFITIDLDVFDPAYLPATGTPEPGGMNYYQVMKFIKKIIKKKKVVGFDMLELCPNETSKPSEFFAAKLYHRIIAEVIKGNKSL